MRFQIAPDGGTQRVVEVPVTTVVIGRDPECDLQLEDAGVSRRHAVVHADSSDGVWIEDMGSANGTFVDGRRVLGRVRLTGGEWIRIGRTALALAEPLPATAQATRPIPGFAATTDARRVVPPSSVPTASIEPARLRVRSADPAVDGRVLAVGTEPVTVGREAGCALQVRDEAVSRRHAQLRLVSSGEVEVADLGSTNGTYVNGRRLSGPARLAEGDAVSIGSSVLETMPSSQSAGNATLWQAGADPAAQPSATAASARRRRLLVAAMAVAALAAVLGGAAFAALSTVSSPTSAGGTQHRPSTTTGATTAPPSSGTVPSTTGRKSLPALVAKLERSTVLIEGMSGGRLDYIGSGTIIRPDGLILTNAHVGVPSAEGLGVQYGVPWTEKASSTLVIAEIDRPDHPAHPAFRATPIAWDGYLDVAVLQVTSTVTGQPVDTSTLHLPAIPLGNTAGLQSGDHLNVLGYPGNGGGFQRAINYSQGSVSGFLPDPVVKTDRAWVKTDAAIAHGNSGGLAADDRGRLVGIPTRLEFDTEGGPTQGRLRAINAAMPVIAAAEQGRPYASPYLVPATNKERWTLTSWGTTPGCGSNATTSYHADTQELEPRWRVSGMVTQENYWVGVYYLGADGSGKPELVNSHVGVWRPGWGTTASCLSTPALAVFDDGTSPGPGVYEAAVGVGPNYRVVATAKVDVGTTGTP